MKKLLTLSLCSLLITTLLPGCQKEEVEKETIRPVKAMQIGGIEVFTGRWFPGKAEATQAANLAFRKAGTLSEFPVDIGDEVKKGDILARLDPRDYQVELNNALAQQSKVEAALKLAEADFARVDSIRQRDPGAVSQAMVDAKRGGLDSARAELNSAKAAVTRARDNLRYTTLPAPFAGTVVEKFVENFEDVQAKQQIVRVVDTTKIDFTVQIPESMMVHVSKVKKAIVVFDARPDVEIPAEIKEIGKEASRTTRTYPVTMSMEQPEGFKVLAGMAGKARGDRASVDRIALEEKAEAVEIPVSATFSDQPGKTFVWVIDEASKKVSKREVQTGDLTDAGILVKGIQTGEWIATAGVNTLTEGQQVRILE